MKVNVVSRREGMDELLYASVTALAQAVRNKEVSCQELVDAYLQRITEVNPQLNAVVQITADTARSQARTADASLNRGENIGPLHGVPMTIKDSIETEGVICTGGTEGRSTFVPRQDAIVVERLREAGAILLGKTNVPELSLSYETDNLVYGRTNNPYNLSCTPGGSSGGEAAIIAAGGSPFGLGSDMAGSIRLPSHFCGIAGIKPTTNRVPRTGHFPVLGGILTALWQIGPMARFVEDLILTLPIISGVDWCDPSIVPMPWWDPRAVDLKSLRVAFHTDNGIVSPTSDTMAVVTYVAKILSDTGMTVEEERPPGIEQTNEIRAALLGANGGASVQKLLQMAGTREVHPLLQSRQAKMSSAVMSAADFGVVLERWDRFRSDMLSFLQKYDVILCPVNAYPTFHHGASVDEEIYAAFSYTRTYNLTGWPSVVVRAGTSAENLPIGVQVVARPWREDVALAVAEHIEEAEGGWQRPPL
jgi:amidase